MSEIPEWLLRHGVTIEPYQGAGAYGDVYGEPEDVRCFLDQQTKLTRDAGGNTVTSTTTFYAPLGVDCPAGSRVLLPDGRQTTVIAALRRDGAGLPTPDHVEVQCA